jgi:hypothetical protein
MIDKLDAILSLVPNSQFVIQGDGTVDWHIPNIAPVTEEQIQEELTRLRALDAAKDYQRNRAKEYPDFREYLDGVVKGDQAQIDAYIAACMAVKEKYPKPEQP